MGLYVGRAGRTEDRARYRLMPLGMDGSKDVGLVRQDVQCEGLNCR